MTRFYVTSHVHSFSQYFECFTPTPIPIQWKSKTNQQPPIVNGRFVSVSPEHTVCRVGGDGDKCGAGGSGVASWGVGKRGQLGHGKRKDEHQPRRIVGGLGYGIRIVQISAGGGLVRVAHTLLLTSKGSVLSFGNAQYGQLGHGYSPGKQLPDVMRPQFIQELSHLQCICVSAGELHSAVVTADGDLYTWGDAFCGQLGLADKRPKLVPCCVEKGGLEDECVLSVSCGARHTLAVTEDGEVFSFGLGHFGVLGRSYTP
jgi:alpha-tubulin suppressor-like RCC1 family protein